MIVTTKFIELSLLFIIGSIVIAGFLTYPGMTTVCIFALAFLIGANTNS